MVPDGRTGDQFGGLTAAIEKVKGAAGRDDAASRFNCAAKTKIMMSQIRDILLEERDERRKWGRQDMIPDGVH
jgi:hypothetical protein